MDSVLCFKTIEKLYCYLLEDLITHILETFSSCKEKNMEVLWLLMSISPAFCELVI